MQEKKNEKATEILSDSICFPQRQMEVRNLKLPVNARQSRKKSGLHMPVGYKEINCGKKTCSCIAQPKITPETRL